MKESERLANMLHYFRDVQNTYGFTSGRISDLECLQNDYLHKLEFIAKGAKERSKIATALANCRKDRRKLKEQEEVTRELADFLQKNSGTIKQLEKILGNMRKVEIAQSNRNYKPRILTEEAYKESGTC